MYLLGVIAGSTFSAVINNCLQKNSFLGSLAVSVTDPTVYLAGASGGVYALIAAHVANLVVVSVNFH